MTVRQTVYDARSAGAIVASGGTASNVIGPATDAVQRTACSSGRSSSGSCRMPAERVRQVVPR